MRGVPCYYNITASAEKLTSPQVHTSMEIQNKSTFEKALSNGANLFTGAGFSCRAYDNENRQLPVGSELKEELIKYFGRESLSDLNLDELCEVLKTEQRSEFNAYIDKRFTVSEYSTLYKHITQPGINFANVFTTNVDDLLHKIYADSDDYYPNDTNIHGPTYDDKHAVDIHPLHGCVLRSDYGYQFSTTEVASAFENNQTLWTYLVKQLTEKPTLFWGHSISGEGILKALSPEGHEFKDMWTTVHPTVSESKVAYYRSLGFQIITATTSELLEYIGAVTPSRRSSENTSRSTQDLFPDASIPDITDVVAPPIDQFYLGSPPRWHHIFRNEIYCTEYYDNIRNKLNEKENLIITGVPACGKTTTMMQVANGFSTTSHKLVFESLTEQKAQFVLEKLSGEEALIFIDNFSDSIGGFTTLIGYSNIQLVGADRNHNLHSVLGSLSLYGITDNIINITELDRRDVQKIIDSIPDNLSTRSDSFPSTHRSGNVSIFEVVESNIANESLNDRFRSVIHELHEDHPKLLEFLLVVCYVHRCRTPISLTMLWSYFHDDITDSDDIYAMRDRIGKMVSEYVGQFDDEKQDYYVPRSTIIAEAILQQAPHPPLKDMLNKFHSNLSRQQIHRYDTFVREAFNHEFMEEVFQDPDEGKRFYEFIYRRKNPSYKALQQCALYLTNYDRYEEAFKMIDKASNESGGGNLFVENSHAIIMFDANISKIRDQPAAKGLVEDAMETLEECYRNSDSKVFHITAYASRSLKILEHGSLGFAEQYIKKSHQWLERETKKNNWDESIEYWSDRISSKMRQLFPEST